MTGTARPDCDPGTIALRVLSVEDNPADAELVLRRLQQDGLSVASEMAQTADEFTQRVRANHYDIILADYNLPQWRGVNALAILRSEGLDIPLILVTGSLGEEKAVECIKQGATDYVLKVSLSPACPNRYGEPNRKNACGNNASRWKRNWPGKSRNWAARHRSRSRTASWSYVLGKRSKPQGSRVPF